MTLTFATGDIMPEVEREAVTTEAGDKPGVVRKITGTWQELHVWLGIVTRTQGWTFRNPAETTPKRGCWRTEYFVKNKPRRNPEVQRTDTIEELSVVCRESQLFDVYRVYSYSSRYRYQRLSIYVACVSRSVHVANIYIWIPHT